MGFLYAKGMGDVILLSINQRHKDIKIHSFILQTVGPCCVCVAVLEGGSPRGKSWNGYKDK